MLDSSRPSADRPRLISPLSAGLGLGPLFEDLARTAAGRETAAGLPHAEMAALKAAGIGALRLPVASGGGGVSLTDLFVVARDLAAVDSNLAHAFRNHSWQVEHALRHPTHPLHARVLELAAEHATVGLSFAETDAQAAGAPPSRVLSRIDWDEARQIYRGSGVKPYATGNLYNDAFVGTAIDTRSGETVQYLVERGEGVGTEDDWQGFGQRMTGSGTMRFRDVTIAAVYPLDPPEREGAAPWRYTFHQIWLTNCIAGIARRITLDAAEVLHRRGRNFYHGEAEHPSGEPVLQALLGRIRAYAAAIEAVTDRAVATLQQGWDARGGVDEYDAMLAATLAASEAKVVADDLAPQLAGWLIDLGSGSVVSRGAALDRHWRNIKVIAAHNPRLYKEQFLGRQQLTGALPPTGAFF